jgi:hypothetical protein
MPSSSTRPSGPAVDNPVDRRWIGGGQRAPIHRHRWNYDDVTGMTGDRWWMQQTSAGAAPSRFSTIHSPYYDYYLVVITSGEEASS